MPQKVLIIPWGDEDLLKLLKIVLTELGYDVVLSDIHIGQVQKEDIANTLFQYQPKVIITHLYGYPGNYNYGIGHDFCRLVESIPHNENVGLIYLAPRESDMGRGLFPSDPCYADEYIEIPFDFELLEQRLKALVERQNSE